MAIVYLDKHRSALVAARQQPPARPATVTARVEAVASDPEAALRHHLQDTQRLATRLLRFEEDLVLATESGVLDHPGAAIDALKRLEHTRSSVANDLRATSESLNRVILARYRAGFDR